MIKPYWLKKKLAPQGIIPMKEKLRGLKLHTVCEEARCPNLSDCFSKRVATVMIMGDARNNYNAPEDWVLREVRGRAKQLIWLNPESKLTWGYGDSEMNLYRAHCHMVEECRNLEQLSRVVDRIILQ